MRPQIDNRYWILFVVYIVVIIQCNIAVGLRRSNDDDAATNMYVDHLYIGHQKNDDDSFRVMKHHEQTGIDELDVTVAAHNVQAHQHTQQPKTTAALQYFANMKSHAKLAQAAHRNQKFWPPASDSVEGGGDKEFHLDGLEPNDYGVVNRMPTDATSRSRRDTPSQRPPTHSHAVTDMAADIPNIINSSTHVMKDVDRDRFDNKVNAQQPSHMEMSPSLSFIPEVRPNRTSTQPPNQPATKQDQSTYPELPSSPLKRPQHPQSSATAVADASQNMDLQQLSYEKIDTSSDINFASSTSASVAASVGFKSSSTDQSLGTPQGTLFEDDTIIADMSIRNYALGIGSIDDIDEINDIHSNEQIIILSSGDAGASESVSVSGRDAGASVSAAVNPTSMRRRSAAAAAVAIGAALSETTHDTDDEPKLLPLRPIIRGPYDDEESAVHPGDLLVVYTEPHTEVQLNCDVDLDVVRSQWIKDGQLVQTSDRNSRPTDNRFIRELRGGLTITNAMLEDDGKWLCKAENAQGYVENARPVKLVVLDRPKAPYLLIDSRRLDAGNIFVPVKENSELTLACITEGGNPRPSISWEVLLSPGVDRHTQKSVAETLELQEIRNEKDKGGVKSEAKLSAVYRAHHNARILCVMEHPTLKTRLNASILLDVQYTPSFAISRTPGFGYPLREGLEVSLKCDVDSNPPSTPMWQKDAGDSPVPQTGDGYLNFSSIRRENSGWYKCSSRHLNFQYSSIGYYLSVRYDSVDVTSEPLEQDISVAASHITPNKRPQLEVQLGGAVTLQCPQGSLGCWSHLDPVTAKLRGLGIGLTTPTGQFSLKDVVYQDAGVYKCIGQGIIPNGIASNNKKKVEVIHTVAVQVKGAPTVSTRNNTPVAYAGAPLHLSVEFCANPPAFAARWLHGDRIYTPGNQYGIDVLAYAVIDQPTPFCKEARLTYVHMHERVPRTFHFVVSSPGGVAETIFHVNFTLKHKVMSNSVDDDDEELSEPEEIHFPVFGRGAATALFVDLPNVMILVVMLLQVATNLRIWW